MSSFHCNWRRRSVRTEVLHSIGLSSCCSVASLAFDRSVLRCIRNPFQELRSRFSSSICTYWGVQQVSLEKICLPLVVPLNSKVPQILSDGLRNRQDVDESAYPGCCKSIYWQEKAARLVTVRFTVGSTQTRGILIHTPLISFTNSRDLQQL